MLTVAPGPCSEQALDLVPEPWGCRRGAASSSAWPEPSTSQFTSGKFRVFTNRPFLGHIFSGPSNEMKEEMKDLKSRVEALEEVGVRCTPLPLPSPPCHGPRLCTAGSNPGLCAARLSLHPCSIFNATPASHRQGSGKDPSCAPRCCRASQRLLQHGVPLNTTKRPSSTAPVRGGHTDGSPSPRRNSSWCWPPSTTS